MRHLCICSHASSIFASAARPAASLHLQQGQRHLCIGQPGPAVQSHRRLASKSFPMALRHGVPGQQHLPDGSLPQCRHPLRHGTPCQQLCRSAPASNCATAPGQQKLRHGAPASNKPHPAEKGTPVWQPIWCTWAGFANSQLRCATFHSTYSYKCTSSLMPTWSRCSDITNLSAHLRRLPTPPTYLRRMRLSPGRWRRFLIGDMAAVWLGVLFEQFTARTNPCSRHLWGTLARSVASI